MNEIDIIKKHISEPIPFEIENEDGTKDIINLKPLNVAQQTQLMILGKNFKSLGLGENEGDMEKKLKDVNDDDIKKVTDEAFEFFVGIINKSVEGITEELSRDFVDSNFDQLMGFTEQLIRKTTNQKNLDKIKEKIKERNDKS